MKIANSIIRFLVFGIGIMLVGGFVLYVLKNEALGVPIFLLGALVFSSSIVSFVRQKV